jgi:hypothetical protein
MASAEELPLEGVPAEEYVGPAVVSATGVDTPVDVRLRGHFEPLDGRYHWYGRIAPDDRLGEVGAGTTVTVTTPHGSAEGRLSDLDPWGRFRVRGTGRSPF